MPNLLQYSNGWGHVIMSIVGMAVAVILLLQHDPTLNGVAIGLIVAVQSYWFISSSAQRQPIPPPAPAPAAIPTPATTPATGGPNDHSPH